MFDASKETEALRTPSWSSTNIVSATPRIKVLEYVDKHKKI
jgi:hypothetical protein